MAHLQEQRDLNVVSPQNLLDPNPLYRHLLEEDPVHWSEALQSWFVTRHEDVAACFRDPRLSADRTKLFVEHQLRGEGAELLKDYLYVAERQMLMKDGAEHARLRRLASPGFSVQAIESWLPAIRNTVDALLDRVQDQGRMDLVAELSEPLPSRVIMEIFAIPEKDREDFQRWAHILAEFFGAPVGDVKAAAMRANDAMVSIFGYLKGIVRQRRAAPGSDMLSVMLQAHVEGRMDEDELTANAQLILTAGHVTTIDQLSNGVHALLTHPEELRKLKESPALIRSAVEEILRYSPAVPFIHRIAAEDFELRGKPIKRGQLVFLGMAAANRDASVFPEPERFDVARENNRHLSFAFGPHMCLGASLARKELEIALERLVQRLPGLRLDEEQPPRIKCNSLVFRGFDALPVRW
jgi:cytochrome P450